MKENHVLLKIKYLLAISPQTNVQTSTVQIKACRCFLYVVPWPPLTAKQQVCFPCTAQSIHPDLCRLATAM